MNEFTITYLVGGQSYSVLDDSTVSASYDITQGVLDVLLVPADGEDIDTALLAVKDAGSLSAVITYYNNGSPAYDVDCEIAGVVGISVNIDNERESAPRQAFISFSVTEFTVS